MFFRQFTISLFFKSDFEDTSFKIEWVSSPYAKELSHRWSGSIWKYLFKMSETKNILIYYKSISIRIVRDLLSLFTWCFSSQVHLNYLYLLLLRCGKLVHPLPWIMNHSCITILIFSISVVFPCVALALTVIFICRKLDIFQVQTNFLNLLCLTCILLNSNSNLPYP